MDELTPAYGHRARRGDKVVCFLNSFLPLTDRKILVATPNTVKSSGLHIRFRGPTQVRFHHRPFFFLKYDLG